MRTEHMNYFNPLLSFNRKSNLQAISQVFTSISFVDPLIVFMWFERNLNINFLMYLIIRYQEDI